MGYTPPPPPGYSFDAFSTKAQPMDTIYVQVIKKNSWLPGWPDFQLDKWHPDAGHIKITWIDQEPNKRIYRFIPLNLTKYYRVSVEKGAFANRCEFRLLEPFKAAIASTMFTIPRNVQVKQRTYSLLPVGAPAGQGRPPRH